MIEIQNSSYCQNIKIQKHFCKRQPFVPNWLGEVFVIKKLKSNVPWTCFISDLKDEEIGGKFTKQNRKK